MGNAEINNMASIAKGKDEINVTFEDQQQINKFARFNAKLQEAKEECEQKKKELQNIEDAASEIEVMVLEDDEVKIPYKIGEVFVNLQGESANEMLEKAKENLKKEIEKLDTQCKAHQQILKDLKVQLYAKFGTNINLENDEE